MIDFMILNYSALLLIRRPRRPATKAMKLNNPKFEVFSPVFGNTFFVSAGLLVANGATSVGRTAFVATFTSVCGDV